MSSVLLVVLIACATCGYVQGTVAPTYPPPVLTGDDDTVTPAPTYPPPVLTGDDDTVTPAPTYPNPVLTGDDDTVTPRPTYPNPVLTGDDDTVTEPATGAEPTEPATDAEGDLTSSTRPSPVVLNYFSAETRPTYDGETPFGHVWWFLFRDSNGSTHQAATLDGYVHRIMYVNNVLSKIGSSLAEATWNLYYDTPYDVAVYNELYCLVFLEEGCYTVSLQIGEVHPRSHASTSGLSTTSIALIAVGSVIAVVAAAFLVVRAKASRRSRRVSDSSEGSRSKMIKVREAVDTVEV